MLTVGYLRQAQRARLLRLSNPRGPRKPTPRVVSTFCLANWTGEPHQPPAVSWQMEPHRLLPQATLASGHWPATDPEPWPFPMAGWSKERPPEWEAPSLLDPHPCRIKRRP